jgi:hypothetical protein
MVAELVRPKGVDGLAAETAQEPKPAEAFEAQTTAALAPPRADASTARRPRFFVLNAAFALLLLGEALAEAVVYSAPEDMALSAPFVLLFAFYALRLKGAAAADRAHYLRWSGWSAAALSVMCFIATAGAVTATPVDVACIIMSTLVGGPLALGGLSQLRAAAE